jgi:hypothetical protein
MSYYEIAENDYQNIKLDYIINLYTIISNFTNVNIFNIENNENIFS